MKNHFNKKAIWVKSLIGLSALAAITINLYGLKGKYILCNIIVCMSIYPFLNRYRVKEKEEEGRFLDICLYLEQMLYAFEEKHKILSALEETRVFFQDGSMKSNIDKGILILRRGQGGESVFHAALEEIEKCHGGERMSRIHHFMISVERMGGNCKEGIDLFTRDLEIFRDEMLLLNRERRQLCSRIWVGFFLTILICGMMGKFLPDEYSIQGLQVAQISVVFLMAANLFFLLHVEKRLARPWIDNEKRYTEEQIRRYEEGATREGYHIGKKTKWKVMKKEIEREFPAWLQDVILLLGKGNVPSALLLSVKQAAPAMIPALEKLNRAIVIAPSSRKPYEDFLKEYQISHVAGTMRLLYGISVNGGETGRRLSALTVQVQRLKQQAERQKGQELLGGLQWMGLFPVLTGSAKLMLDMVLFTGCFVSQLRP